MPLPDLDWSQLTWSALNWLDWLVVIVLLWNILDGTRRGFLLGALGLLSAAAALAIALVGERPLADELLRLVPGLAAPLAHVLAFVALVIIAQVAIGALLGRPVVGLVRAIAAVGPLRVLDAALGALPGLVHGLITASVLLLPFALLPLVPALSQAIQESVVANRLVGGAMQVMPAVEARLGQDFDSGLIGLVVTPPAQSQAAEPSIPVRPASGELQPDAGAEQRMLELVNAERSRAGLRLLAADERLRDVARAHSLEMFQLGYFSHESPVVGSPFDRLRSARIPFLIAGENLAYAPSVEIAHQGLMNSPGHRANILRPEFGRVGIGVQRSQFQGSMFTQNFTN